MHVHGIKARKEKKTLIQHVKGKQTIQIEEQRLKKHQKEPTEAYGVKEMKKQKLKT